jgi:Family of unknown function (DUF6252)
MQNSLKISILLFTFIFSSCGGLKSKIDSVNPLGGGTMTAKIDGTAWKSETFQIISKATLNTLFSIAGVSITAKNGIGVNFDLTKAKIEAGKSYTCGYNQAVEITHEAGSAYYETDSPQGGTSGTVKVTSYDGTSIKGTFSGTLYDSNTKKKVIITEGTFDGKTGAI